MTISTQQSIETFLGNGSTTTFNFSFVPDSAANIVVSYTDANGNVSILSSSQYTLNLNPPGAGQLWGVGGSVIYPLTGSPIANGTSLTIQRVIPFQQLTTISDQGDFSSEVIEQALDIIEMQLQEIAARTGLFRGTWKTGIAYNYTDIVIDGANGANTGNAYICAIANTSGTWSADLAAGDWVFGSVGGQQGPAGNFTGPGVAVSGNLISFNGTSGHIGQDSGIAASNVALLSAKQTFSGTQSGQYTTLTSSSNLIAIDLTSNNNFFHAMTQNTTLQNPSAQTACTYFQIEFVQSAGSAFTLSFSSNWTPITGVAGVISTTLSAKNLLSGYVAPSGKLWYTWSTGGVT